MYQDDLVCILHPEVKKGIIIYTHYIQQPGMNSLCTLGLKTGKKLQEEGIDFSRNKIHPYIFFRAPYYSREINYSTPETEIISSFGEEKNYFGKTQIEMENYVYIRVDPDRTFVFSSEIRAKNPQDIQRSKKTLSNYLSIIANNAIIYSRFIEPSYITKKRAAYNLFTSELIPVPLNETYNGGGFDDNTFFSSRRRVRVDNDEPIFMRARHREDIIYPLDTSPIERNSEILISIPHLTPDYFVLCT